jgi:hypothetical protein
MKEREEVCPSQGDAPMQWGGIKETTTACMSSGWSLNSSTGAKQYKEGMDEKRLSIIVRANF